MAVLLSRQSNPSGSFLNPGAGPRQSWALDTTQNITYSTVFSSYTIALWQQFSSGGGANLGPILLAKHASTPPQTSFLWTVQLYGFDLAQSDEFFFWIFNGTDAAAQGIVPAPSVSSAYFTIKKADLTTTTTSKAATTASKTASTPATTASKGNGETGTSSTTGGASVAASGGGDGGGVNVVAVGVGVGIGVLVLVGLVALGVWWWLWKKTAVLDGLKKENPSVRKGPAEMDSGPAAPDTNKTFMYPSEYELRMNHAAELSVGPAAVEMGGTNTGGPGTMAELPSDEFVATRTGASNRVI